MRVHAGEKGEAVPTQVLMYSCWRLWLRMLGGAGAASPPDGGALARTML